MLQDARVATAERVLPNLNGLDSDELKALIREQHAELISQKTELDSQKNEIESLKLLILKLRRMQFGTSSERLARHIDQLELRLEDLETNRGEPTSIIDSSLRHNSTQTSPPTIAGGFTAGDRNAAAQRESMSGLRRHAESPG